MTLTDRVVALTTNFLPVEQARHALLPPVRVVRSGAVVVARTVRHWELLLEGTDPSQVADPGPFGELAEERRDSTGSNAKGRAAGEDLAAGDLPVQDWAELSYADAQARLAGCDESDLRTLLDYEQTHGHRPQYTLLLEQRLASGE